MTSYPVSQPQERPTARRPAWHWSPTGAAEPSCGATPPVRFRLSPLSDSAPQPTAAPPDAANALQADFAARLTSSTVRFALHVQKFVTERLTPIEDGAVEWKERDSPPAG